MTAIATGLSWLLDYSGRTVGLLPSGLPSLTLPQLSWGMLNDLWAGALLVTLIGFAEVLTVTKACAASTRQSIDLNRELIGQGMASLGAAGSGGFPPSGSLSRSALSLAAGARTGLTAVIAALVIAGILLFGTAALAPLPMATLAAAVIVSVLSLVDFSGLVRAWRIHAHDGAAAILAFLLTLGLAPDLISGFLIAGVLALGLFLWRAMHPRIAILAPHPDGTWRDYQRFHLPQSPHVAVLRLDRSLFFANVEALEQAVLALLHERKQLRAVVLACAGINEIDASGCAGLKSIQRVLKENNALLVISELKVPCLDTLDRAGLLAGLGADAHFRSISEAVRSVASRTGIDTLPWPIPESSPCGVVRVEDSGRLTVMRSTAP